MQKFLVQLIYLRMKNANFDRSDFMNKKKKKRIGLWIITWKQKGIANYFELMILPAKNIELHYWNEPAIYCPNHYHPIQKKKNKNSQKLLNWRVFSLNFIFFCIWQHLLALTSLSISISRSSSLIILWKFGFQLNKI